MAVHEFQPTEYYTTFARREPVLRIGDGDTVRTTTVDSSGLDAEGEKVADAPNPQTGPFWVAGAEPGDTLEVRLGRLWPNRDTGVAAGVLAPNVVDPDYLAELPTTAQPGST